MILNGALLLFCVFVLFVAVDCATPIGHPMFGHGMLPLTWLQKGLYGY